MKLLKTEYKTNIRTLKNDIFYKDVESNKVYTSEEIDIYKVKNEFRIFSSLRSKNFFIIFLTFEK